MNWVEYSSLSTRYIHLPAMAVSHALYAYHDSRPMLGFSKLSLPDMQSSNSSLKWIDEEIYRNTILSLNSLKSEKEVDESLRKDAQDLGLLPVQKYQDTDAIASSLSATTISSEAQTTSIMSQSTAPTSCGSSERRPSTSRSNKSSRNGPHFEPPTVVTEMERKRHSGFKSGLRKMTGFRKKKTLGSATPSLTSLRSERITATREVNTSAQGRLRRGAASMTSRDSFSSHDSPVIKTTFEPKPIVDEAALRRTLDCEQLARLRTQQIEEKRRFLEYQTRLVKQLLQERDRLKAEKVTSHEQYVREQEERNEMAVEEFEARQLEDELKQLKDHETEKRAIQTRLKHMEAYCQTPSPPNSPLQLNFEHRPSLDSITTLPERHVTQQHYENLAQAYHLRDNMDDLHASKINVLRGKQKRALQNFILKRERELEQTDREHQKELDSIDLIYAHKEDEIRQEFDAKRITLECRWKLQSLVERARMEQSTGLKYEALPDIVVVEALKTT